MPSSSYSDIPEITAKFKSKVDKTITDSNTGQNMKILFLNNLIERNGQISRPVFEGLRATFPRGITLEDNKWKGLCVFSREFSENMEILESEEHTQQKGWCAKSLVNMTFNEDIDCKTATSVADTLEICRTPEAASRNFKRKVDDPKTADIVFEVPEEETPEEEELLGMIEELEKTIEDIEEDDDYYEYTEEAKENYVESHKQDVKDDPVAWLRDYGMEDRMDQFIDREEFIDDVIISDGRGHTISSYDGEENEIEYNNEWYYIYRMN